MVKKFFITLLFFAALNSHIHAYDNPRLFWSFGDIGAGWDTMASSYDPFLFLKFGNINWMTNFGLGWGFHLFELETGFDWIQSLILPVEINFSPLRNSSDSLLLTLYGRGGLLTKYESDTDRTFWERSGFTGAAGLRAAWFPTLGKNWSIYTGAFVEYTTKKELRVGISVDFTIVALVWLLSAINSESDSNKNR